MIEQGLSAVISIVRFVIVLGIMIFMHELGHFIVAKLTGVYVHRFSLGFGPRLLGFPIGETDYCVSAIPFGGYVRMAGQYDMPVEKDSDGVEMTEEWEKDVSDERRFTSKTVPQRITLAFAGPFMNLVLGVVAFVVVFVVGQPTPKYMLDTRIGTVVEGAPADEAGIEVGDRIVEVDGRPISEWAHLSEASVTHAGRKMNLLVERDGQRIEKTVESRAYDETKMPGIGVYPFLPARIKSVRDGWPAKERGIQPGDVVTHINGKAVSLDSMIDTTTAHPEEELLYTVERDGKSFALAVSPRLAGTIPGVTLVDGVVAAMTPDAIERVPFLSPNDKIVGFNSNKLDPKEVGLAIENHVNDFISILVLKPKAEEPIECIVQTGGKGMIGIALDTKPETVIVKSPLLEAIPGAFAEGYRVVKISLTSFYLILTGRVSPKLVGGPVFIFQMTTEAADVGFTWLIHLVGFISVHLFVINLLPIPVLDGGLILLAAVEGIRGRPVDIRFQEALQRVGIFLLLALALLVTYNDILRWLGIT